MPTTNGRLRFVMLPQCGGLLAWFCVLLVLGGSRHLCGHGVAWASAEGGGGGDGREYVTGSPMAAAAAEDVKFEEEEEEEDISIRRRRRNHEHRENLEALFNADFDLLNSDFLGYLAKYLVRREFPILNFLLTNVLAAFITPPLTTCPEGW